MDVEWTECNCKGSVTRVRLLDKEKSPYEGGSSFVKIDSTSAEL
jgi:hypothetical protein